MKEFFYVVKDAEGLHARPAGLLAKQAARYQSDVFLLHKGKKVSAKKLFSIMGLAVKCSDAVTVQIEGPDEEQACQDILKLFTEQL